jgi:flagellar hook-associated protein 2
VSTPTINFGGLASGVNWNEMVTQLMAIERNPQVRIQQQQRIEEARQSALRDVKTRLANLQTAVTGLSDPGTWSDSQSVESNDASRVAVTRTGGAAPGGYAFTVTSLARAQQMTQGTALAAAAGADELHISLGGGTAVDVGVAAGDTIQAIAEKINSTSGIPVYAAVVSGKLVLSGKETGAASTISVTSDGTLAADLGMAETQAARNADFTVDGTRYTDRASNVVSDLMPGLTVTLKGVTSSAVSVTVGAPGANKTAIQDKMKAFVDQYNSTIEFVRGKLSEKRVANPKTEEERLKGVLAGDAGLTSVLANLRTAMSDVVAGAASGVDRLSLAGVSTGSASRTVNQDSVAGKLTLDTAALAAKLETRFADTKYMLTNRGSTYATKGVAQRLDDILSTQLTGTAVLDKRIESQTKLIDQLKKSASAMDVRLAAREKALRAQFTAMESAMAQAQSQGSYLAAQLGSLSASSA